MTKYELRARLDLADRAVDRALASERHAYVLRQGNTAEYAAKRDRLMDAFERRHDAILANFMMEVA